MKKSKQTKKTDKWIEKNEARKLKVVNSDAQSAFADWVFIQVKLRELGVNHPDLKYPKLSKMFDDLGKQADWFGVKKDEKTKGEQS